MNRLLEAAGLTRSCRWRQNIDRVALKGDMCVCRFNVKCQMSNVEMSQCQNGKCWQSSLIRIERREYANVGSMMYDEWSAVLCKWRIERIDVAQAGPSLEQLEHGF